MHGSELPPLAAPPISITCSGCRNEMRLTSIDPTDEKAVYTYECANGHQRKISTADPTSIKGTPTVQPKAPRPRQQRLCQQGWVMIAFHNAFRHLASGTPIEDALVETVGEGVIPTPTLRSPVCRRCRILLRQERGGGEGKGAVASGIRRRGKPCTYPAPALKVSGSVRMKPVPPHFGQSIVGPGILSRAN
jgi:hypothetical protein